MLPGFQPLRVLGGARKLARERGEKRDEEEEAEKEEKTTNKKRLVRSVSERGSKEGSGGKRRRQWKRERDRESRSRDGGEGWGRGWATTIDFSTGVTFLRPGKTCYSTILDEEILASNASY